MNPVENARKISGITREGVAAIIGVTAATWDNKEKDPCKFTLGQYFTLYREMDTDAQNMLWSYLEGLRDGAKKFCDKD